VATVIWDAKLEVVGSSPAIEAVYPICYIG